MYGFFFLLKIKLVGKTLSSLFKVIKFYIEVSVYVLISIYIPFKKFRKILIPLTVNDYYSFKVAIHINKNILENEFLYISFS